MNDERIQLRWAVPDRTEYRPPVLQWRELRPDGEWSEWKTVPIAVLDHWEWGSLR